MMLRTAAKTAPLPGGGTEWRVRLSLVEKYMKCTAKGLVICGVFWKVGTWRDQPPGQVASPLCRH